MSTEEIHGILFLFVIVFLLRDIVRLVIDFEKEFRRRVRKRLDFWESLKHGAVFVERLQTERDNPFLPIRHQETVRVLETRINQYGETWVKYQREGDNGIWYCPAQDFDKLYVKKQ